MTLGMQFGTGAVLGTGAAVNVQLGWIPDYVRVVNVTDGDIDTEGFLTPLIAFTSGGTTEIKAGDTITGNTSKAKTLVAQVLLISGTWAGGDAAGWLVTSWDDLTGTFGTETVSSGGSADSGSVTAAVQHNIATAAAVAGATGNAALSAYRGVAGTNAKGFTIGSTVSESGKLLRFAAWRNG